MPDAHKFYFFMEGEGWLRINGAEYSPKPGQLFLIPEGVHQAHGTVGGNTFLMYWCHFSAGVSDLNILQALEKPDYINVEEPDKVVRLFKDLIHYHRSDELLAGWKVNSILLELLCYFFERSGIRRVNLAGSPSHQAMETVIRYMEENISEPLSVKDLAKQVHLNPNYFSQLFRGMLGLSPIHYLNRMRIEKAKTLLAGTELTVSEIASRVGIEPHYFSRMFKAQEGYSPSHYRKMRYSEDV
ncbi:AraC family transcriptional regulator [Paenibacillus sp. VCA1]|uniref:AraC family transcriptional regulator n=1 Tax=Paenibacillus sp. VCA1 TaxID=3039148 RepID=UPI0028710241|nr:AraC family transcriptional regulator [Paenibacillus sp. VCA1]MDR9853131.1 AraC family transcriptional regulator [Paenibacillus sp. VCA1]